MTITQRAPVHDVVCDVVCTGRFYDFLERRDGVWGIVLRQPIYEQDRLNPVDPAAELSLDQAQLERFPVGYRHLAYLQTQIGFTVKPDMPGLTGAEVEALYARGAAWLDGVGLVVRAGCGSSERSTGRVSDSICHSPAAPAPAEISFAVSSSAGTMRSENSSIETRWAAAEQLIAAIVPECALLIGAATERRPISSSWSTSAQPCARTCCDRGPELVEVDDRALGEALERRLARYASSSSSEQRREQHPPHRRRRAPAAARRRRARWS